jgi:hypothetical protein
VAEVSTTGVEIVPGPNVWAWGWLAQIASIKRRTIGLACIILPGRQLAKVSDFLGLNCAQSRPNFDLHYDLSQPVNLFLAVRPESDAIRAAAMPAQRVQPHERCVLPASRHGVPPLILRPRFPTIPAPEASRHKISPPPRDRKPAGQCDQENVRPCMKDQSKKKRTC